MRREKGITLIALVITIIVLLILAAVSITALTDEDKGVVTKAKQAAKETEEAAEQEDIDIEEIIDYAESELEEKVYTVTFSYKDTNGDVKTLEVQTDETGKIDTSLIPTVSEYTSGIYTYTFDKWVESDNSTAVFDGITENKTVTAVYTATANESICFVEGTEVLTENGLVNIEDVEVGMKVYSYNEKTEDIELKEVKQTFINTAQKDMVKVTVNGEVIESTSKHEYYVVGKGWTEAFKLEEGNILLNSEGKVVLVENVELVISDGNEVTVYNMEVADNHNYFVGEECVLVHNKGSKC